MRAAEFRLPSRRGITDEEEPGHYGGVFQGSFFCFPDLDGFLCELIRKGGKEKQDQQNGLYNPDYKMLHQQQEHSQSRAIPG